MCRYRDEHVRALWFADRQAMTNCARLSLDWGPDPGQKRLAVSYLRLRRLLDVSDRKEHTNLSFISNFSEVRARCVIAGAEAVILLLFLCFVTCEFVY